MIKHKKYRRMNSTKSVNLKKILVYVFIVAIVVGAIGAMVFLLTVK